MRTPFLVLLLAVAPSFARSAVGCGIDELGFGPIRAPAPARFFAFTSEAQYSSAKVKAYFTKYGANSVIGGNPVDLEPFNNAMKTAQELGMKTHAYLEGPGGPTGDNGWGDELPRIREAARSVGISGDGWLKKWDAGGWKTFTRNQIRALNVRQSPRGGLYSAEIDNLSRVLGDGAKATVEFIAEYQGWLKAEGLKTKLVLKNLDKSALLALAKAINAGRIQRDLIADYHIAEKPGCGKSCDEKIRRCQAAVSAFLGIQIFFHDNTYRYVGEKEYGLRR